MMIRLFFLENFDWFFSDCIYLFSQKLFCLLCSIDFIEKLVNTDQFHFLIFCGYNLILVCPFVFPFFLKLIQLVKDCLSLLQQVLEFVLNIFEIGLWRCLDKIEIADIKRIIMVFAVQISIFLKPCYANTVAFDWGEQILAIIGDQYISNRVCMHFKSFEITF
jgi:hypothetical protein